MSDQQKQNPGTQRDEWQKKQQDQQHGGQQKSPQADRDNMEQDQQKKQA